jgi:hypothetical protein
MIVAVVADGFTDEEVLKGVAQDIAASQRDKVAD